jgi:hypothetical protein
MSSPAWVLVFYVLEFLVLFGPFQVVLVKSGKRFFVPL